MIRIRMLALAWAVLSLILAAFAMADFSMLGFPDGHMTVYEAETLRIRRLLIGLCLIQATFIAAMTLTGRIGSVRGLVIAMFAAAVLVVAPLLVVPSCPGSETCRRAYEIVTGRPMDHGAGG